MLLGLHVKNLALISKPSLSAASKTLSTTISARLSPSRIIGQRIPLEMVPTLLSIKYTSFAVCLLSFA